MSVYRISTCIAYHHEQGMFMFMIDGHLKLLPAHYVNSFDIVDGGVLVTCDSRHHKETFSVASSTPEEDVEKLRILKEEF